MLFGVSFWSVQLVFLFMSNTSHMSLVALTDVYFVNYHINDLMLKLRSASVVDYQINEITLKQLTERLIQFKHSMHKQHHQHHLTTSI